MNEIVCNEFEIIIIFLIFSLFGGVYPFIDDNPHFFCVDKKYSKKK